MLNRLARIRAKDRSTLILPSLDVVKDREVIEKVVRQFVRGQRELES